MNTPVWSVLPSALGELTVARDGTGIIALLFAAGRTARDPSWTRDDRAFDDIAGELAAYFAGTATAFAVPLHPSGSAFQLRVWSALREIPFGETVSYGDITRAIGAPLTAARAVGRANGQNPISIVVPCHRVIGAGGSLVGYGGGLPAKRWLLEHEARHAGLFTAHA